MKTLTTIMLAGTMMTSLAACSDRNAATTNTTAMIATDTNTAAPGSSPASNQDRVRGTLTAVDGDMLTVRTYDGKQVPVALDVSTNYAWVLPASLSDVKQGDFIGTATTGPDTALKAVEVVIFPDAMRGSGEGHYDWDTPAVIQANGGGNASSAMTNGTVANSAMTNGSVQNSAMTNGTVSGNAGANGQPLTISYKSGTSQVAIPRGIPIVRFDPAQKAILANGQKLFVVATPGASGKLTAKFVAAGKDGLLPPM